MSDTIGIIIIGVTFFIVAVVSAYVGRRDAMRKVDGVRSDSERVMAAQIAELRRKLGDADKRAEDAIRTLQGKPK